MKQVTIVMSEHEANHAHDALTAIDHASRASIRQILTAPETAALLLMRVRLSNAIHVAGLSTEAGSGLASKTAAEEALRQAEAAAEARLRD